MWILFALSGPVLWAASTHVDKYLVERYFKNSSAAVLMAFTALIGLLALPWIRWFEPRVLSLPTAAILAMVASGLMYMGAMLLYLRALQSEEASVVAPLFQLSAVWGYVLAFLLLGETLSARQLSGGAMVLGAGGLLSLDPSFRTRRVKARLFLLMAACTFVLALSSVVFKFFATRDAFWPTTFWLFVGEALFGILLLAIPACFRQFVRLLRKSPGAVFAVNGANELINLGGGLGVRYASILAPVALVQALSSTTTLFVFGIGIVITLFFPSLGREDLSRRNLAQKGAAALLAACGIALMN